MLRLLSVALLPLLIAGQEFQCGTDKIQSDIAKTVVQFNCKDKVSDINHCCITHDGCYDQQQPRGTCDAAFCSCVQAASAGNPLCGFYTNIFCDTTKVFGEAAYKKVGEERRIRDATSTTTTTTAVPTTTTTTPAPTPKPEPKKAETFKIKKATVKIDEYRKAEIAKARHMEMEARKKEAAEVLRKELEARKAAKTTQAPVTTTQTPSTTTTPTPSPTTTTLESKKGAGESRHKEEKLPGDKAASPAASVAPEREQTSSEEDREVADLEARLAREEAELEREEAEQRRVLEALEARKSTLRAELQRFREAQRLLWKHKEEDAAEESTPSTTTTVVAPTTTTVVATTTTVATKELLDRAERRALKRLEMRTRQEEMQKKIDDHKARVLAAKTLRFEPTPATEKPVEEPKVTVTSEILEGSGQHVADPAVAATWSDDNDLIPESE